MRPVNVSLSYTHLYITFPVHVLPVPSPRRGASQCTCFFYSLQFYVSLSPDGLYILNKLPFSAVPWAPSNWLDPAFKATPDTGFSWDETTHENFPGSSSHDIPRKEKPSTFLKAEFGDLSRNTKSHEYPYNTDLACS